MNGLSQKVAVITGAGKGIGRATAIRLAQEGARVVIFDLDEDALRETATLIDDPKAVPFQKVLDVTRRPDVERAFQEARSAAGPIDVLVNNVGQSGRARASEFWCSTPETWDFVVNVSLMSTLNCSRQVAPEMRERRIGRIVNISSDTALMGDSGLADYAAAKAGVIGFTRSLARELAPFGVTANAVCPGGTLTHGFKDLAQRQPWITEKANAQTPMGALCEPEDVASGIAFLASDDARFITGQILAINGGRIFY